MLAEQPPYKDTRPFDVTAAIVARLRRRLDGVVALPRVRAFGFGNPRPAEQLAADVVHHTASVDAHFSLQRPGRAEVLDAVVTVGLRDSRFALILFWEILHALRVGGIWVDLDRPGALRGTRLCTQDLFLRPYFSQVLEPLLQDVSGDCSFSVLRKTDRALAEKGTGRLWSFGILTAKDSDCAAKMIEQLLALSVTGEILVAGPLPSKLLPDPRVRRIEVDSPDPRGWITRKKNLVVMRAAYDNVGLLHDRFALPPGLDAALGALGCPGVFTFPQLYFPTYSRVSFLRHLDYHLTVPDDDVEAQVRLGAYRSLGFPTPGPSCTLYPRYNDFHDHAFCTGGAIFSRTRVLRALPLDERLHHNENEDTEYGLRCHRFGVPHRVNPLAALESLQAQHFNVWQATGLVLQSDGSRRECRTSLSCVQLAERVVNGGDFKPLARTSVPAFKLALEAALGQLPEYLRAAFKGLAAVSTSDPAVVLKACASAIAAHPPATREDALALLEVGYVLCAGAPFKGSLVQAWCRRLELSDETWALFSSQWARYFRVLALLGAKPILGALDLDRAMRTSAQSTLASRLLRLGQRLHMKSPVSRAAFGPPSSLGAQLAGVSSPDGRLWEALLILPLALALWPVQEILGSNLAVRLARGSKDLVLRSKQPRTAVTNLHRSGARGTVKPLQEITLGIDSRLPLLTLEVGQCQHSTVMVSARGLWDRFARPASSDALVRAYQRTLPCMVTIGAGASPSPLALGLAQVRAMLEKCALYGAARIEVPFILDVLAEEIVAEFSDLTAVVPGCKLVRRWPTAARGGLFPIVDIGSGQGWAWRLPIETVTSVPAHDIVRLLVELDAKRIVIDSVNVLTRIADARAFPPEHEEKLLDRIVAERPGIEIWRVSDLLEAEFLDRSQREPLL
jgi:hypothetical protein